LKGLLSYLLLGAGVPAVARAKVEVDGADYERSEQSDAKRALGGQKEQGDDRDQGNEQQIAQERPHQNGHQERRRLISASARCSASFTDIGTHHGVAIDQSRGRVSILEIQTLNRFIRCILAHEVTHYKFAGQPILSG
jgi:hypothetical protein